MSRHGGWWLALLFVVAWLGLVVWLVLGRVETTVLTVAPTQTPAILVETPLPLMTAGPATTRTVRPTMTPLPGR